MKCSLGVDGELTKEFDIASPGECRSVAAITAIDKGKPVTFVTSDGQSIVTAGTGRAEKTDKDSIGRDCAKVSLADGRSANICSSPALAR